MSQGDAIAQKGDTITTKTHGTDSNEKCHDNTNILAEVPPQIEDSPKKKKSKRTYRHTFPVHTKALPSPLSKEAPPESYRGFVNLGMLLLFGNNIRLVIENYQKYGFLLSIPGSNVSKQDWILAGLTHAVLPLHVIVAYKLEQWASRKAKGFRKRFADQQESSVSQQPQDDDKKAVDAAATGDRKSGKSKGGKKDKKTLTLEEQIKETRSTVGWLHFLNVSLILVWPSLMSYFVIFHPFLAMGCLMTSLILFLKMTSFALVNQDLRSSFIFDTPVTEQSSPHSTKVHNDTTTATSTTFDGAITTTTLTTTTTVVKTIIVKKEAEKHGSTYEYEVSYPHNITLGNIGYFYLAPTLCYQPSYPRSTVFRPSFFFKRVLEIITCLGMMYFLVEQYATPTLQNSVRAFDELAFGRLLERVLKLSTTSVIIWLLMFYTFFHAFFNALAEILYFGDRRFYLSWWNATSVGMYWKTWNSPVYTFFKRHVYLPMITSGHSAFTASIVIFTISAILHEVLIGIPTKMIYGYAFAGMFFQIPLIALTAPLEKWRGTGSGLGNMIFWVSFTILGQPACALLYYYHWTKRSMNA
ncbi:MAG: MBOAT, membrane-bound O-acyltransferase family-domain-containing protein [Linnemannia gamsii]|nr:MAG: MBOAT, membrane-bound O-acyltransferase family-domain-containing protein [Linnemannia gamsii]